MTLHPPSPKIMALAEKLIDNGDNGLTDELNDLTIEECRELDSVAFRCTCCDWWFHKRECVTVEGEWQCEACSA